MSGTNQDTNATQEAFQQSVSIMARLRAPGGCPWDREQTFSSIQRHTLEEAYEVLDAIDRQNWPDLKDELGDLLLQVLFYSQMAAEAGHFTLHNVLENLNAKLIRRHPHVFGELTGIETADAVRSTWETIKQEEQASSGVQKKDNLLLDAVPRVFPALLEAEKLSKKAAEVGFDWNSADDVLEKVHEEITELREAIQSQDKRHQDEELGDLLFTIVNLGRKLHLNAELSLRAGNTKFRRRFGAMEEFSRRKPLTAHSASELEQLWVEAKKNEDRQAER